VRHERTLGNVRFPPKPAIRLAAAFDPKLPLAAPRAGCLQQLEPRVQFGGKLEVVILGADTSPSTDWIIG